MTAGFDNILKLSKSVFHSLAFSPNACYTRYKRGYIIYTLSAAMAVNLQRRSMYDGKGNQARFWME